jgi:hypothetical protein
MGTTCHGGQEVSSPNVFLHHLLDIRFEDVIKP